MFKVGDRVKILGRGVRDGWVKGMDEMIGTVGTVTEVVDSDTYRINDGFLFASDEIADANEIVKKNLFKLLQDISYGFEKYAEELEDESDFWKPWSEMHKYISDNL